MRGKLTWATGLLWSITLLGVLAGGQLRAPAAEWKLQVFLLWGTDDTKPPEGKNYRTVDPDILRKLKDLPLKWSHWFEVNRVAFTVPRGGTKEAPISEKCKINVTRLGGGELEVTLIGKGK